jgi:hypothetical protein
MSVFENDGMYGFVAEKMNRVGLSRLTAEGDQ